MSEICFLGIDTSNYTTSLAIADEGGEIIANLKIPLSVKSGERGLRQSDAVFQHTKNLPEIFSMAEDYLGNYKPVAVGVSVSPRSKEGSYMPCFLAGKAAAYSVAKTMGVPLFELSHQNGHVMAAAYSGGVPDELLKSPFLAFHVSGGTTEALLVRPTGYDFSCEIIGGTKDINAGQAIDRVGVAMGLDFPCGPELERLALECGEKIPQKRVCVSDGYCNLSGLENKAVALFEQTENKNLVAAYVIDFVGETLERITDDLRSKYPGYPIVYSGGVMSCSILRDRLKKENCYFAKPAFSADNAAGIALLCRKNYLKL
jgi:N6-L-threonylcarbamoyladenine synthase